MTDLAQLATVVVPTVGRPSLLPLLDRLAEQVPGCPVVVVDDRLEPEPPLPARGGVTVVRGRAGGPAAARNRGWRRARTPWVVFVDDDVLPTQTWGAELAADLAGATTGPIGAVQGRVHVPLPVERRPTDWERGTAGLATARWITADLAYRRDALVRVGGFDERFPRAYREDSDLALRVLAAGYDIVPGSRRVEHPVRPADRWVSVRQQAGNADDVLMRRRHGRDWRRRAGAPRGRRRRHLVTVGAAVTAAGAAVTGHRKSGAIAAATWLALTTEFAAARLRPGPRTRAEVTTVVATSLAIPFAAAWHTGVGILRHRAAGPWRGAPDLVLFDRDGTLVVDVPYNGDAARVRPMPGATEAVGRLRAAGVRIGVVTNQSGVARGLLTSDQVAAVNARVDELFGGFDTWGVCEHGPADGCECRKPASGLVKEACAAAEVPADRCLVIGDIGADVTAAQSAGARAILVPTPVTRPEEVLAAPRRAPDLATAVAAALDGDW